MTTATFASGTSTPSSRTFAATTREAAAEAAEYLPAFLGTRLVRDGRDQVALGDVVHEVRRGGEDDDSVAVVTVEDATEFADLVLGLLDDTSGLLFREESLPCSRVVAGAFDEFLVVARRPERDVRGREVVGEGPLGVLVDVPRE